jgi:hypothetical protein
MMINIEEVSRADGLAETLRAVQMLRRERNREIQRLREEDPVQWTYTALANLYGLTRARVCQICGPLRKSEPLKGL